MERSGVIVPDSRLTHVVAVQSTVEASQQGCSCRAGEDYKRKVNHLERRVAKLEEVLADKDAVIASLKAKNKQTRAELIEFQLQKVGALTLVVGPIISDFPQRMLVAHIPNMMPT